MSKAMQIFNQAFHADRMLRSSEYKDGALYVLMLCTGEGSASTCPHAFGTAKADAWLHGCEEGHHLWRMARIEAQQTSQPKQQRINHVTR